MVVDTKQRRRRIARSTDYFYLSMIVEDCSAGIVTSVHATCDIFHTGKLDKQAMIGLYKLLSTTISPYQCRKIFLCNCKCIRKATINHFLTGGGGEGAVISDFCEKIFI